MNRLPIFFRWLILAALVDWLVGRTLTRLAIFMPKSPAMIAVYQTLGLAGQVAATLAGLLALAALIWIARHEQRTRSSSILPAALIGLAMFSLVSLISAPVDWPAVIGPALVSIAAGAIAWRTLRAIGGAPGRTAALAPMLAFLLGALYQGSPALYQALYWPGPPPFSTALFGAGELLVALAPIGLCWARRAAIRRRPRVLIVAALPALLFAALHIANPALSGILSIWSIGLTLYLPWPLYAVSIWLTGALALDALRQGEVEGWAVLLLAAGGYAAQLSTQVFYGLIALWLLALPRTWPAVSLQNRATGRATTQAFGSSALSGGSGT